MTSIVYRGRPALIVAVADGHGDPAHDLSDEGAMAAVEAAIQELSQYFTCMIQAIDSAVDVPNKKNQIRTFISMAKTDFPRSVRKAWKAIVGQRDSGSELVSSAEIPDEVNLRRYGTTLMGCLVTEDHVVMFQIGDGQVYWCNDTGTPECVFQVEEVGSNRTDSLCSSDSVHRFQVEVRERTENAVIILITDGVVNSYQCAADTTAYIQQVQEIVRQNDGQSVAESLDEWLRLHTDMGSCDDATIGIIRLTLPLKEHLFERRKVLESQVANLTAKVDKLQSSMSSRVQQHKLEIEERLKTEFLATKERIINETNSERDRLNAELGLILDSLEKCKSKLEEKVHEGTNASRYLKQPPFG